MPWEKNESKKNNTIVKGNQINDQTVIQDIQDFLQKDLNITFEIKNVVTINTRTKEKMAIVKLSSWEDKKKTMIVKNKLGIKKWYIVDM